MWGNIRMLWERLGGWKSDFTTMPRGQVVVPQDEKAAHHTPTAEQHTAAELSQQLEEKRQKREALLQRRDELKASADSSSDKNRNFLIAFLAAMLYLVVTIGSTTDKDLLMPESLLQLPILNVKVGLIPFYVLAPILLLLFHLSLLYNLLEHMRRLHALQKLDWEVKKTLQITALNTDYSLHAFVFNSFGRKLRGGIDDFVARTLTTTSVVLAPFLIFILFQFRFWDYQSIPITTLHFILVLLDILVIMSFWWRISNRRLLSIQSSNQIGRVVRGWANHRVLWPVIMLFATCLGALALGEYDQSADLIPGAETQQWWLLGCGIFISFLALWYPRSLNRNIVSKTAVLSFYFFTVSWLVFICVLIFESTSKKGFVNDIQSFQWQTFQFGIPFVAATSIAVILATSGRKKELTFVPPALVSFVALSGIIFAALTCLILYMGISGRQTKWTTAPGIGLSVLPWQELHVRDREYDLMTASHLPITQLNLIWTLVTGRMTGAHHCEAIDWLCPRLVIRDDVLFSALDKNRADAIKEMGATESRHNERLPLLPVELIAIDLSGRSLRLADFSRSKIYGAKLTKVEAAGSIWNAASLEGVDLEGADLGGANLIEAGLDRANMERSNLTGAFLDRAKLNGARLSYAILRNASLGYTILTDTNLYNADLIGARLYQAEFYNADLTRTSMQGASLVDTRFVGVGMSEANIAGADLQNSIFINVSLRSAVFTGANMSSTTITASNLVQARLVSASLVDTSVIGTTLAEADLTGAYMYDMTLTASILSNTVIASREPLTKPGWTYFKIPMRWAKHSQEHNWPALHKIGNLIEDGYMRTKYLERIDAAEVRWKESQTSDTEMVLPKAMDEHEFIKVRRDLPCDLPNNGVAVAKGLLRQQTTEWFPATARREIPGLTDYCAPRFWQVNCPKIYTALATDKRWGPEIGKLDEHCLENFTSQK